MVTFGFVMNFDENYMARHNPANVNLFKVNNRYTS